MIDKLDALAKRREPFLFFTDFKGLKFNVFSLDELEQNDIEFVFNENFKPQKHALTISKHPCSFDNYKLKFDQVIENIKAGNSYLFNLTASTDIECKHTLKEIFKKANAPFKLRFQDKFVCFSPEKFITIQDNIISTYPMKGTIDASLTDAKKTILNSDKETAEHVMIVDLLRNDLSMVAKEIKVDRFRYTDVISAGDKELLHVSSKISGKLDNNWQDNLPSLLKKLLPAGSISGTPKKKTMQLIEEIEQYDRDYFSGIFGIFNKDTLNSAVMIRFIEQKGGKLIYKSGGGITIDSDAKDEYRELNDKIYIP